MGQISPLYWQARMHKFWCLLQSLHPSRWSLKQRYAIVSQLPVKELRSIQRELDEFRNARRKQ